MQCPPTRPGVKLRKFHLCRPPKAHPACRCRARGRWPPFLIGLDQCHKNVELIARWRPTGRAPRVLDLHECGTMVFVGADRADLHGGPHQNLATVRASTASYSACVPIWHDEAATKGL